MDCVWCKSNQSRASSDRTILSIALTTKFLLWAQSNTFYRKDNLCCLERHPSSLPSNLWFAEDALAFSLYLHSLHSSYTHTLLVLYPWCDKPRLFLLIRFIFLSARSRKASFSGSYSCTLVNPNFTLHSSLAGILRCCISFQIPSDHYRHLLLLIPSDPPHHSLYRAPFL